MRISASLVDSPLSPPGQMVHWVPRSRNGVASMPLSDAQSISAAELPQVDLSLAEGEEASVNVPDAMVDSEDGGAPQTRFRRTGSPDEFLAIQTLLPEGASWPHLLEAQMMIAPHPSQPVLVSRSLPDGPINETDRSRLPPESRVGLPYPFGVLGTQSSASLILTRQPPPLATEPSPSPEALQDTAPSNPVSARNPDLPKLEIDSAQLASFSKAGESGQTSPSKTERSLAFADTTLRLRLSPDRAWLETISGPELPTLAFDQISPLLGLGTARSLNSIPAFAIHIDQFNQFNGVADFVEEPIEGSLVLMSGEDFLSLSAGRPSLRSERWTSAAIPEDGSWPGRGEPPRASAPFTGATVEPSLNFARLTRSAAENSASANQPDRGSAGLVNRPNLIEPHPLLEPDQPPDPISVEQTLEWAGGAQASQSARLPNPPIAELRARVTPGAYAESRLTHEAVGQLGNQIQNLAVKGQGEMRLRLNPEGLGEMLIHVSSSGSNVRLRITASDEGARAILERSLKDLKESLNTQQIHLAAVEVGLGVLQADQREGVVAYPQSVDQTSHSQFTENLPDLRPHFGFGRESNASLWSRERNSRQPPEDFPAGRGFDPLSRASGRPPGPAGQSRLASAHRLDVLG